MRWVYYISLFKVDNSLAMRWGGGRSMVYCLVPKNLKYSFDRMINLMINDDDGIGNRYDFYRSWQMSRPVQDLDLKCPPLFIQFVSTVVINCFSGLILLELEVYNYDIRYYLPFFLILLLRLREADIGLCTLWTSKIQFVSY